jgi:hemoglobin
MSRCSSVTKGRGASVIGTLRATLVVTLISALLTGCASAPTSRAGTLYERLGGDAGIAAITEGMLARSAEDPRIRDDFAEADIVNLYERLVEHLCMLSGGPCTYTGRDMKAAHAGLGLTEADFNALVENLVDAMTEREVPIAAQNELLAILAPMRGDVIRQ